MAHQIEEMIQRGQIERARFEMGDAIIAQANCSPSMGAGYDPGVAAKAQVQ